MHDWRGTEIEVGSRVVYPVRQGSSMWMTEIEVTAVVEDEPKPGNTYGVGFIRGKTVNTAGYVKDAAERRKLVTVSALRRVTVIG